MENFFVKDFSATTWVRILKFGTKLDSDELYCVTKEQPHIAYQSLYLFFFSFSLFSESVTISDGYRWGYVSFAHFLLYFCEPSKLKLAIFVKAYTCIT